ncbi:hypothetical protein BDL97_19G084400 [Sphagnum fallax]|nr:hypothetical protein BDL97_19G084400 [Sphagnum fallax]
MLLRVICVPKVLSSFKSGSFMSKEARAGCLLVVTRGVPYCAGNIWKDLITTSLTGGACSLRLEAIRGLRWSQFAQYAKGTNDNLMRALLSGGHLGSVRPIIELELEREFTQSRRISDRQDLPPVISAHKVHANETGTGNRALETETPHHIFVTAPRASCTNTPILKI